LGSLSQREQAELVTQSDSSGTAKSAAVAELAAILLVAAALMAAAVAVPINSSKK
jgi:hypothetical protein